MSKVIAIDEGNKRGYALEWHRPQDMAIDLRVNREPGQTVVRRRAQRFNPDALGTLVLALIDRRLLVVDGGHRRAVCIAVGYSEPLPCQVWYGLDISAAAALFRLLNERTLVVAIESFLKGVIAGAPDETAVNRIVEAVGLRVGMHHSPGEIACVSQLLRVHRGRGELRHPERVEATLRAIVRAWGLDDREAVHKDMVGGIARVFARDPELDPSEVGRKLSALPPHEVLAEALKVYKSTGRPKLDCVAYVAVKAYNKGRRSPLAPWPL